MFAIRQFSKTPVAPVIKALFNSNTIKVAATHIFINTGEQITKLIDVVGFASIPSEVSSFPPHFVGDCADTSD